MPISAADASQINREICSRAPIVPVLVVRDASHARPLAEALVAGGLPVLRAIGGPLPQISFRPTGGVNPGNAVEYLSLTNVICAGGSWVAPDALVTGGRWDEIEALARAASQLGGAA